MKIGPGDWCLKNHVLMSTGQQGESALVFGETSFIVSSKLQRQFISNRDRLIMGFFSPAGIPKELWNFLLKCNLVYKPTPNNARHYSSQEAIRVIRSALEMWRPLLTEHPLFKLCQSKKGRYNAILYLIESTVFISESTKYFKIAADTTRSRSLKRVLRKLSQEEANHHQPLLKCLGISEKQFESHEPIAGTVGLISYLYRLATQDPLSLLIVTALFESDKSEVLQIKAFYKKLSTVIGMPLSEFSEHHLIDIQEKHIDFWEAELEANGKITLVQLNSMLASLHLVKHLVLQWQESIFQARCSQQSTLPVGVLRLRPEMRSIYLETESL